MIYKNELEDIRRGYIISNATCICHLISYYHPLYLDLISYFMLSFLFSFMFLSFCLYPSSLLLLFPSFHLTCDSLLSPSFLICLCLSLSLHLYPPLSFTLSLSGAWGEDWQRGNPDWLKPSWWVLLFLLFFYPSPFTFCSSFTPPWTPAISSHVFFTPMSSFSPTCAANSSSSSLDSMD